MPSSSPLPLGEGQGEGTHSIEVTRFGQSEALAVSPEAVITFPQGVVGLDHLRRFALVEDARVTPCRWLQSLDEPEIAFVVVDPRLVEPDYDPQLSDVSHAVLLAIITLSPVPQQSTVNLLAPIVIDTKARQGRQVVLHESGYSLRHPIGSPPAPDQSEDARPSA